MSEFYHSGHSRAHSSRIEALKSLLSSLLKREAKIVEALREDLGRPLFEVVASEISPIHEQIELTKRRLRSWMEPVYYRSPRWKVSHFMAEAYSTYEPYGLCLIVGPWNYPFQLSLIPLAGSIAAGNVSVLKPSELAPHSSQLLFEIVSEALDPLHTRVIQGGVDQSKALLAESFDKIFFTGSPQVGKIVMKAAAENLSSVTLELGGKSPCILTQDINLETAVKRIIWAKCFNAGQTCVAPDYVMLPSSMKKDFVSCAERYLKKAYPSEAAWKENYSRIINHQHFDRLSELKKDKAFLIEGVESRKDLHMRPSLIDGDRSEGKLVDEEIFGPLLPVFTYKDIDDCLKVINSKPKPLVIYLFSSSKSHLKLFEQKTSSGAIVMNDALIQFNHPQLPIGGVGYSGVGKYHGRSSFECFSHKKSIEKKSLAFDFPQRYPPYMRTVPKWLRRFL